MRDQITGFWGGLALGLAAAGLSAGLYLSATAGDGRKGTEGRAIGRALTPPPMAREKPDAREVLRVWMLPGSRQQVKLRTNWGDPGVWGIMLVDIAKHARNAYVRDGHDGATVLARIREMFDAEWSSPTDTPLEIEDDG